MKSCFRHEIKKATVGNLLHLKIQVCSSCKNTCCVLANLSQISQHGAHTPLVPIILHFRIRAPRNERGKVKFVQSQSIQMQEIQLGPLLTVFIAEHTYILFSLEYLLLEAHRPWDVEGVWGHSQFTQERFSLDWYILCVCHSVHTLQSLHFSCWRCSWSNAYIHSWCFYQTCHILQWQTCKKGLQQTKQPEGINI